MSVFHLFRIKLERPDSLFDTIEPPPSRAEMIRLALAELNLAESTDGRSWRVGNLEPVTDTGYYLVLGKLVDRVEQRWVESTKSFERVVDKRGPHTPVLLDVQLQVAGIAPHTELAREAVSLGRRLNDLLNKTELSRRYDVKFLVSELPNPAPFIEEIRDAYAVQRFWYRVTRPNYFDQEELNKMVEGYVQEANGREAKVEVKGTDLDREVVEKQTRAVVASGEEAKATIKRTQQAKPITIDVRGGPVTIESDASTETPEGKVSILERIIQRYQVLRGRNAA